MMISKYLISCKKTTELMSESMDGRRLSLSKFIALKIHLTMCDACIFYLRQLKKLRHLWRQYTRAITKTPPSLKNTLSSQARERIKSFLRESSS